MNNYEYVVKKLYYIKILMQIYMNCKNVKSKVLI